MGYELILNDFPESLLGHCDIIRAGLSDRDRSGSQQR